MFMFLHIHKAKQEKNYICFVLESVIKQKEPSVPGIQSENQFSTDLQDPGSSHTGEAHPSPVLLESGQAPKVHDWDSAWCLLNVFPKDDSVLRQNK